MAFTVTSEDQRCWRAEHLLPRDGVVHHTGVVPYIWGLHFSDVQTPSLLRDKSTAVLLDKERVFIEDPCKCQLWKGQWNTFYCSTHLLSLLVHWPIQFKSIQSNWWLNCEGKVKSFQFSNFREKSFQHTVYQKLGHVCVMSVAETADSTVA